MNFRMKLFSSKAPGVLQPLRVLLLLLAFGVMATGLAAQSKKFPPKPNPPRLVNDLAGVMSAQEVSQLEYMLDTFAQNTGNQIAIIVEKSLGEAEVRDYTAALAENWGIGQKERRNGVLIYVALAEKQSSIMVGYGLEPVITDVKAFTVRKEILGPYLKQGQFFAGFMAASIALQKMARQEFSVNDDPRGSSAAKSKKKGIPFSVLLVIVVVAIWLISRRNKGGPGNRSRGGSFVPPIFFGGGGHGGRGGWGGSSSGGFGGFGGGSFGGGGSSGSW